MTTNDTDGWTTIRPVARGLPALGLAEFWTSRELTLFLAQRDLKVRYKQTMLGVAWVVFQPLSGALAFTFLFNGLAKIETDGSYFVFALTGFLVWSYVSGAASGGADSLLEHEDLIRQVSFPMIAPPCAAILIGLVDLAVGSTIAVAWSVVAGDGISLIGMLVGAPAGVSLMILIAIGPAFFFGTSVVKYRDSTAVLGLGLQIAFFLAPIAYPADLIDQRWRTILSLNPVTGCLSLVRWGTTSAPPPELHQLAISVGVALVMATAGLTYFRRNERTLVDVI